MVRLRAEVSRRLAAVTEDSDFEAEVLLETVFGRDYRIREISGRLEPTEEELSRLEGLLKRRLSGEPLQYIVGEWEFYGLNLKVRKGVLIPRQDTEALVEAALALIEGVKGPRVLDLCSGTGCVALAIKKQRKDAEVWAAELYPEAFEILCENLSGSGVSAVNADALSADIAKKFSGLDLITANPPYLTEKDMENLQREVMAEPKTALYGGIDGLDFYRALPKIWRGSLKGGGHIAMEIGLGQESDVSELLKEAGFKNIGFKTDLTGRVRAVFAEK